MGRDSPFAQPVPPPVWFFQGQPVGLPVHNGACSQQGLSGQTVLLKTILPPLLMSALYVYGVVGQDSIR